MKKTHAALAVLALICGSTIHAAACPVYEFAELQTYTEKELHSMAGKFITLAAEIGSANMSESQNCFTQFDRVKRVIKMKKDAQAATPAK